MVDRNANSDGGNMPIRKGRRSPATSFDPITAALREIHSKVADEAIPDDFMRLLDQFDAGDGTK